MKATLQDVIDFIGNIDNHTTYNAIQGELNDARKRMQLIKACQFRKGMKVQFTSKYGNVITGTVHKVNRSTIDVRVASEDPLARPQNWRVSPGLLIRVE